MARILIIEDEPALADALYTGLCDEHHVVDVAHDGREGLLAAESGEHDLLLLDLMLPGLPGLEVCRRLRAAGSTVPILVLTARDAIDDVVRGLDVGADDYLTKPFAFEELLARVRALIRRQTTALSARTRVGPLELDLVDHRVWRDEEEIALTAREFQLLELLVRRQGAILSKERITESLWNVEEEPESNAVEVHIARLRGKLDRGRTPRLIHTVRGLGYVVRVEGE